MQVPFVQAGVKPGVGKGVGKLRAQIVDDKQIAVKDVVVQGRILCLPAVGKLMCLKGFE